MAIKVDERKVITRLAMLQRWPRILVKPVPSRDMFVVANLVSQQNHAHICAVCVKRGSLQFSNLRGAAPAPITVKIGS